MRRKDELLTLQRGAGHRDEAVPMWETATPFDNTIKKKSSKIPTRSCLRRFSLLSLVLVLVHVLSLRGESFREMIVSSSRQFVGFMLPPPPRPLETFQTMLDKINTGNHSMDVIEFAATTENLIGKTGGSFGHNALCIDISRAVGGDKLHPATPETPSVLTVTVNCQKVFKRGMGTGNILLFLYGTRVTARRVGNISVFFTCKDAEHRQKDLVLPWLMGWFPAVNNGTTVKQQSPPPPTATAAATRNGVPVQPTMEQACESQHQLPIQYHIDEIRYELRRMAVALVGVPSTSHPAAAFLEELRELEKDGSSMQLAVPEEPLVQGVELDETVIHYRCGDLMVIGHRRYGFPKFSTFREIIASGNATTIGIVTQPFAGQRRVMDRAGSSQDRCKVVIEALKEYLQQHFPKTVITIRNEPSETIALSYARMIMANQTISVVTSTFNMAPAMASFGTGYIRKPDPPDFEFLSRPPVNLLTDNVVMVDDPVQLRSSDFVARFGLNGDEVLEWFRS